MILCIDSGNSRLKWAIRHNAEWLESGVLLQKDLDLLPQMLPQQRTIAGVIACNVAGADRARKIETLLPMRVQWVVAEKRCGVVTNGYDDPERLGVDRWVALIGAHARGRQAALVVLAGTATTIDILEESGQHRGGLILPGLLMMTESLARGTAELSVPRGQYRATPRKTEDAIASGAIHATLGAIQRMFAQLPPGASCLLSGGAAEFLAPHIELPNQRIDNLVLEGLACIATG